MSRTLACTLLFLAGARVASGQTGPERVDPAPLTVAAAVAEALEHNPDLIALRREFEAMQAAPAQERFLAPPMFETQIWGWPVTTLNPVRTDMYMFMVEQELPGRGKRAQRELVRVREAEMSRQQIAVRANDILREVRNAVVELAAARETAGIYQRQAPLLEQLTEAATVRYAAARSGQQDAVRSLGELTRLQLEALGADEAATLAEARLNALLGRAAPDPVPALAPVAATAVLVAEAAALEAHPEMGMANAAIAREEAELARLRGERRPDFFVGGGYMLTPGDAGAWTGRAGLTWSNAPWSRGRLITSIEVQQKRLAAALARRDAVATTVRRAIREAAVRVETAERRAALIASTVLPQLEHAFELARLSYASGEGGFADVVDAQRVLRVTQLEHVAARADADRARADLAAALGPQ